MTDDALPNGATDEPDEPDGPGGGRPPVAGPDGGDGIAGPDQPGDGKDARDKPDDKADDKPDDVGRRLEDGDRVQGSADFLHFLTDAVVNLGGGDRGTGGGIVNVVIGDVKNSGTIAGRDVHGGGRRAFLGDVVAGPVSVATLDEIDATFVRPESYRRIEDLLTSRSAVLLQAPPGWGRTTTGLHLLGNHCEKVNLLHPDADLRQLGRDDLAERTGYLLEARTVEQLHRLRVSHFTALAGACRDRDARVVVTVDASIQVGADVLREFGIDAGPPPGVEAILRRHLVLAPGGSSDELDPSEMDALITEVADASPSMRETVELAGELARVAAGELGIGEFRDELGERSDQTFTTWLTGAADTAQHALIIALAVFGGMPYVRVAQVESELEQLFRQAEDPENKAPRQVFGELRTDRLARARAETFDLLEPTPYGVRRVEGVRFRHGTDPVRILRWVWHEHDVARNLTRVWLDRLGRHPDRAIRVRAAAAIGVFATFDLEWARRTILLPWARSDDLRERENAVAALNIAAAGSGLAPVTRMLRAWVTSKHPALRWTGARALGISVGRTIRHEALRMLRGPAGVDDVDLSFAIGESLVELYVVSDDAAAAREVLDAVTRWSGSKRFRRRQTATVCFLLLALDVREEDADGHVWPALLALADRDSEAHDQVVALWRQAFGAAYLRDDAEIAFGSWVRLAAGSTEAARALKQITAGLIADDTYVRGRLRLVARAIRARRKRNPPAADAADVLLEQLGYEESIP